MKRFLRRHREKTAPPDLSPPSRVLRRLLSYVIRYRGEMAIVVVLLLIGTALNLLVPYLLGEGLNSLSTGFDAVLLRNLVLGMVVASLVSWLALLIKGEVLASVTQRSLYVLRWQVFEHMQTLSLNFFDRQPIGELMSRVTDDSEVIAQFFRNGLGMLLSESIKILFIIFAMFLLNWRMAIAACVIVPLVLSFLAMVSRISGPAFDALQAEVGNLNGIMEETVSGERVVIAYQRQEEAIANFEEVSKAAMGMGIRAQFVALLSRPITLVLTNLDVALVALVGGLLTLRGEADVGTVTAFLQYTRQFGLPITNIANTLNFLLAAITSAERVFQILDETPVVRDRPAAIPMPPIEGKVEFRNVDFSYVPGRRVLKNNSFEVLPGQTIGLCGPTGAGKSTIINLITRYYDIDAGEVLIDDYNLLEVQQTSLRHQTGIVLQEPFLFSDTVMNNLRYARLEATEAECIEAAKRANAHDFVLRLPNGYDTMMTERGSNLSQGQRQLLTIARMMVANPRMVILDEATSNVDTRTEAKIQEALDRLMAGRTSFVIAHRLSTIRHADKILVLNAGELVEQGTHEELLLQKGLYYELYTSQFKGKVAALI
ncbi:MAG: ABC transporter ATP-binding protein [Cyanobacteria bacterium J06638_22]